jgi:hypothetical protein
MDSKRDSQLSSDDAAKAAGAAILLVAGGLVAAGFAQLVKRLKNR